MHSLTLLPKSCYSSSAQIVQNKIVKHVNDLFAFTFQQKSFGCVFSTSKCFFSIFRNAANVHLKMIFIFHSHSISIVPTWKFPERTIQIFLIAFWHSFYCLRTSLGNLCFFLGMSICDASHAFTWAVLLRLKLSLNPIDLILSPHSSVISAAIIYWCFSFTWAAELITTITEIHLVRQYFWMNFILYKKNMKIVICP